MSQPQPSPNHEPSAPDQVRRMLELELEKTRCEASAARLEAKAAQIELILRKLGEPVGDPISSWRVDDASSEVPAPSRLGVTASPIAAEDHQTKITFFPNWSDVRAAQQTITEGSSADSPPHSHEATEPNSKASSTLQTPPASCRIDAGGVGVGRPHFLTQRDPAEEIAGGDWDTDQNRLATRDPVDQALVDQATAAWSQAGEEEEPSRTKTKPGAWVISAITHLVLLFGLAALGIQTQRPKDQVAFTASVSESQETAMESFSMKKAELEVEPQEITEETPVEVEYELSPVGEMEAAEAMTDVSPVMQSSMAASLSSRSSQTTAQPVSMKSHSAAKMKFCGVESGGNHFVYLVDSSGSMEAGFESARRALLSSIDLLRPEQRFYVVFFDAQPDFMRITDTGQDEPRSVYATPENKAAVRRWAMRIGKDRGRAPYDPLKFALSLKPDVIFLLSDGEFPEGIVRLLKQENRVENLFGEVSPISIVHTIGYHSQEGASIMKRIASQNHGQYRHVPKP